MDARGIIFLRATTMIFIQMAIQSSTWQSFMHLYRADIEIRTMTRYYLIDI
jgi:hypothetical protein